MNQQGVQIGIASLADPKEVMAFAASMLARYKGFQPILRTHQKRPIMAGRCTRKIGSKPHLQV